jgi:GNAT superfamily N-acetyltransferase
MMIDGLTPDRIGMPPFNEKSEVIYAASADDDIVGVVAFERGACGNVTIQAAYVEPSSRRQGVFKAMHQELAARVYAEGYTRISAEVPADTVAAAVFAKLGFPTRSILTEQKIV